MVKLKQAAINLNSYTVYIILREPRRGPKPGSTYISFPAGHRCPAGKEISGCPYTGKTAIDFCLQYQVSVILFTSLFGMYKPNFGSLMWVLWVVLLEVDARNIPPFYGNDVIIYAGI
jgi:hypothetical protein